MKLKLDKIPSIENIRRSTVLEILEAHRLEINKFIAAYNNSVDAIESKLDKVDYIDDINNNRLIDENGNFTGSWFGIKEPKLADPGIVDYVEKNSEKIVEVENTLTDKINDVDNYFKNQLDIDFNNYPLYANTLKGYRTSVMQNFVYLDDDTILMSQVGVDNPPNNDYEHFTISRLNKFGQLIDYMEIINGGHGGVFNAHIENGEIKLVFNYINNGNNIISEINYFANTRIDMFTVHQIKYPKYNNEYQLISISKEDNLLVLATKRDGRYSIAEVYNLDEYKNGTQVTPLYVVDNFDYGITLQGFEILGNNIFVWVGTIGERHSQKLIIHNIEDNTKQVFTYDMLAQNSDIDLITTECEGINIKRNGNNISILVGISTSPSSTLRVNHIYSWSNFKDTKKFISDIAENSQIKIYERSGNAIYLENQTTKLSDVNIPGLYYFTAVDWLKFTDIPIKYQTSGWWVQVYPYARDGSFIQEIIRNTDGRNTYRLSRIVRGNGDVLDFTPVKGQSQTIFKEDLRGVVNSTHNLTDSIKNYDMILIRVRGAGGAYSMEKLINVSGWDGDITVHGTNIPDTPGSVNLYQYEMRGKLNIENSTFTQTALVEIKISGSAEVTRTDDISTLGIQEIIGIVL